MNDNDVRQALLEQARRGEAAAGGPAVPPGWDDVERRAAAIRSQDRARRTTLVLGSVAAAVALLVGTVALLNNGDDGRKLRTVGPAGSTTTSAEETTTSTTEAPTTTTTAVAPVVTSTTAGPPPDPAAVGGIYPTMADYQRNGVDRYRSPEATATAFAKEYLGMKTPTTSSSRAGSSAGTRVVDVRPNRRASLTTTVELRQAGGAGGPWTVTGARAQYIKLDSPKAGAKIVSGVTVSGQARAYEGHVNVEVRQEGQRSGQNLGETFVTGASDTMSPFEGQVSFKKPSKAWGAIVLTEPSADDGSTMSATVIRVTF